jgi:group I intron endonuclease
MIGVYAIRNKLNGKTYIGSSNNINRRWGEHKWQLKYNRSQMPLLQREALTYGVGVFELVVVEECEVGECKAKEQRWLLTHPQLNRRMNAYSGYPGWKSDGRPNPMQGKKHSEETKKKIGDKRRAAYSLNLELA